MKKNIFFFCILVCLFLPVFMNADETGDDYYEVLMTRLSFIAYSGSIFNDDSEKIYETQSKLVHLIAPDYDIVWGPAVHKSKCMLVNDALVYIAKKKQEDNYIVVVRGTNPFSLKTWLVNDLNVMVMRRWKWGLWSSNAPWKAKISWGTKLTLRLLKKLTGTDRRGSEVDISLVGFLESLPREDNVELSFTGHSLGGLAASTLALWFRDKYPELADNYTVRSFSLAGPTAGNKEFADYSNSVLQSGTCTDSYNYPDCAQALGVGTGCNDSTNFISYEGQRNYSVRYINNLDIAVQAFNSCHLESLYKYYTDKGYEAIKPVEFFGELFFDVVSGKKYTQLSNCKNVELQEFFPLLPFFVLQIGYQHVIPYVYSGFDLSNSAVKEELENILKGLIHESELEEDEIKLFINLIEMEQLFTK